MVVLITGGTGLIGSRVSRLLAERGHDVRLLSRTKPPFLWDPAGGTLDQSALDGTDAIVHLAGESIAGRWTAAKRQAIVDSRRKAAQLLQKSAAKAGRRPVIVSASAIGFYGDRGSELLAETARAGTGFLAETTVLWEEALQDLSTAASRSVIFRVGVVLDRDLGALPKMAMPVRMFAGAPLGDGRQFISWIHIEDVARMICVAVDPSFEKQPPGKGLSGIYNAAAPNPATNKEMTQQIAQVLHRPAVLPPVPAFFLRTVLGDMSALVLESARVSSLRIQETGFEFRYPTLLPALQNLLGEP